MGKASTKKKCNSVTHFVSMDGVRVFYEKIDTPITYQIDGNKWYTKYKQYGVWAMVWLVSKFMDFMENEDRTEWPPHSLMCECTKCTPSHFKYKKVLRSK